MLLKLLDSSSVKLLNLNWISQCLCWELFCGFWCLSSRNHRRERYSRENCMLHCVFYSSEWLLQHNNMYLLEQMITAQYFPVTFCEVMAAFFFFLLHIQKWFFLVIITFLFCLLRLLSTGYILQCVIFCSVYHFSYLKV